MGIKTLLPAVVIAAGAVGLNGCANWNADEWAAVAAFTPFVVNAVTSSDSSTTSADGSSAGLTASPSYSTNRAGSTASYGSSKVSSCTMSEYRAYERSLNALLAQIEAQKGRGTGICAPVRQAKTEVTRFAQYLERCPEFDIDGSARRASYQAIPTYNSILAQACR